MKRLHSVFQNPVMRADCQTFPKIPFIGNQGCQKSHFRTPVFSPFSLHYFYDFIVSFFWNPAYEHTTIHKLVFLPSCIRYKIKFYIGLPIGTVTFATDVNYHRTVIIVLLLSDYNSDINGSHFLITLRNVYFRLLNKSVQWCNQAI